MPGNPFYTTSTNCGSKKGENNFDVSMGAFDGAEVCELIGVFRLFTT